MHGYGGQSAVSRTHNVSRATINRAKKEIESEGLYTGTRQRKEGAGRPTYKQKFSEHMTQLLETHPEQFVLQEEPEANNLSINNNDNQSHKNQCASFSTDDESPDVSNSSVDNSEVKQKARKRRGLDIDKMIKDHSSRIVEIPSIIIVPYAPLDPESWIEQIIQEQFAAVYGNPAWPQMYVNLTLREIKERFERRTGKTISIATLWNILHSMGYSLHKNMKYEQVGEPHPLRNDQFIIIQSYLDEYKKAGDIVLSIDSKAAIKLGCFYANGTVWCPEYQDPRVLDHDFAFTYNEIYPDGTTLIPSSFMNERAIVKVSGVYDMIRNSAHVTVGISKDTSEFAGVSLINAWQKVSEVSPSSKRILVLGDGGGSNRTTGFLWKKELANLSRVSGCPVMMCHYPPGCSKYDPIEHRVWGPVSKNMDGSPMKDCERVLCYLNNTTNKSGLKVTSQLDVNEYLTQPSKTKLGISPFTKQSFELIAEIQYPHKKDALSTWNYLITSK